MHKPLDSMNSNVLLARVSLRDNLLCVCDLKGVIVFASDDLLWALGLQGPTTRHIGASLFDLLADEDVEEYKVGYGGFLVEKSHRKATVSHCLERFCPCQQPETAIFCASKNDSNPCVTSR